MTVKELIKELRKLPKEVQDFDVLCEGCDCFQAAKYVEISGPEVLIRRR